MTVRLPGDLRNVLECWARENYPQEACGVLIGRNTDIEVAIADVVHARNLNTERARDRYELDPQDLLRAEERALSLGLDVVGIWHTHPDHPARPSETDRARAWEAWIYLIVPVRKGDVGEPRAWRLNGSDFVENKLNP